jgi:hypothetical protein
MSNNSPKRPASPAPEMAGVMAAVDCIQKGTCAPLDAAKILRHLRTRPELLNGLFFLPHSEPVRRTLNLINLEDEPFQMVVDSAVSPDFATVVGRFAPHDAKLQSAVLAVLAKHKPDDEIKAEAIVRDTINEDCERRSRELKRRHAERTFGQHYWDVGAVLSWIAYRDGAMICQFEDYQHWQRVKRYGHEAAWKVVDPGTEMVRALEDGRLRAIQKKGSELPAVLPAEFWARKTVKDLFMIDPDFRRAEILTLWADPAARGPGDESTVAAPGDAASSKLPSGPDADPDQQDERQVVPATPHARTRRGPRASKCKLVIEAMKGDIREKRLTPDQLSDLLEKHLKDRYGQLADSRDTLRKARKVVLAESEFVGISNPDK